MPMDFALRIEIGALFQSLVESPMNEFNVLGSFRFCIVTLLVVLASTLRDRFSMFNG